MQTEVRVVYKDLPHLPQLSDTQLKRVIRRCEDARLATRMRLTCGNCGIFAIALRNMRGRKGDIVGVGQVGNGSLDHVLYREKETIMDANGVYDDEYIPHWGNAYGLEEYIDDRYVDNYICDECARNIDVPTMERLVLMLADKNTTMEEILDYYDTHQMDTDDDYLKGGGN